MGEDISKNGALEAYGGMEAVEAALASWRRDYESRPPALIAKEVLSIRALIDPLLAQSAGRARLTRATTIAAWADALLANACFDMGNYRGAARLCVDAMRRAEAAHLSELCGWIRLTEATTLFYLGRYHEAVQLAESGRGVAGATPISARIASSVEARSYAALGEVRRVHSVLDAAERIIGNLREAEYGLPGRYVLTLHPADLAAHAASALNIVGDMSRSLKYLDAAGTSIDSIGPPALQSMIRLDEAQALLLGPSPDIDRSCELGLDAMRRSAWRPVTWVRNRAAALAVEIRSVGYVGGPLEELEEAVRSWKDLTRNGPSEKRERRDAMSHEKEKRAVRDRGTATNSENEAAQTAPSGLQGAVEDARRRRRLESTNGDADVSHGASFTPPR